MNRPLDISHSEFADETADAVDWHSNSHASMASTDEISADAAPAADVVESDSSSRYIETDARAADDEDHTVDRFSRGSQSAIGGARGADPETSITDLLLRIEQIEAQMDDMARSLEGSHDLVRGLADRLDTASRGMDEFARAIVNRNDSLDLDIGAAKSRNRAIRSARGY